MLEKIIKVAINHRWLVMTLTVALIAIGIWSARQIPIDVTPDITNVQVQINTEAAGYSPLEAEQRVTFPIETAMAGLPKMEYFRSISRYGLSQVTVVFKDGTDIYFARQQVSERVAQVKAQMPEGIEPTLGPIATGMGEIFSYTIDADPKARKPDGTPYTATDLRTLQDWVIRPQLRNVPGVTEVNTMGGFKREVEIAAICCAHVEPVQRTFFDLNGRHILVARFAKSESGQFSAQRFQLGRLDGKADRTNGSL